MTITTRKGTRILKVVFLTLAFSLTIVAHAADDKKAKEQQEIRKMAQNTLQRLYKAKPEVRGAVQGAAGYAVFSNTGLNILLLGSGKGEGIAVNSKSKTETFMKVVELQAGLGFGVKKFSVIFVFDNDQAFDRFVNSGWEFGGQTTAAATTGEKGGALAGAASVSPGVWMYQMTDKGVALDITAKGTKYYKDDDLN